MTTLSSVDVIHILRESRNRRNRKAERKRVLNNVVQRIKKLLNEMQDGFISK